MIFIAYTFIIC